MTLEYATAMPEQTQRCAQNAHADFAPGSHPTEEQLDELLIESDVYLRGSSDALEPVRLHLAACSLCRDRLEEMRAPLAAFNASSLRWSEARSHTASCDLSEALERSRRFGVPVEWLASVTAVLALAAALTVVPAHLDGLFRTRDSSPPEIAAQAALTQKAAPAPLTRLAAADTGRARHAALPAFLETAAMTPMAARPALAVHPSHDRDELAQDNAILLAIDSAIDPQEPAPDEFSRAVGGGSGSLNKMVADQVSD